MSVPIAEPSIATASARGAESQAPRNALSVVGVAIGIALIAACAWFVWRSNAGPIDGEARLREGFEVGELPFQMRVADASRLFFAEETVRLASADVVSEPEKNPVPEKAEDEDESADEPGASPKFDWSKVPVGPVATAPRDVSLVWYPPSAGEAAMNARFRMRKQQHTRDLGPEGGRAEIASGTLVWGEYAPQFVHEREFEAGGTFRDWLRVNLSTPGQYCEMIVRWPRGSAGTQAHAIALLNALAPKSKSD